MNYIELNADRVEKNYQDVIAMNKAWGFESGHALKKKNKEFFSTYLTNIKDEITEFYQDGVKVNNLIECRDALCDIRVFAMGALHMLGLNNIKDALLDLEHLGFDKYELLQYFVKDTGLYTGYDIILRGNTKGMINTTALLALIHLTYMIDHLVYDNDGISDMDIVLESNLSKFVTDEQCKVETKEKYDEMGVEVDFRGEYPMMIVYSTHDQVVDGKNYPKSKILKSVNFIEPVLN